MSEGRRQVSAPRPSMGLRRWSLGQARRLGLGGGQIRVWPAATGWLSGLVLGDNQAGRNKIERFLSRLTPYVTTYITPGSLKPAVRYLNPFGGARARRLKSRRLNPTLGALKT